MTFFTTIPETCTAEEAAASVALLAAQLGIPGAPPDVRTLRLWRTKRQISIEGRNFTRRNVLEVLVIHKLRQEGLTTQHASQRALGLDEERLRFLLLNTDPTPGKIPTEPII